MEYRKLGRTGLLVSPLCLGTMNFGPFTTEPDGHAIMDKAHELGLNFFDTANGYGRVLGEGVSGPSNPLRVGIANGAAAIREAIDKACGAALIDRDDLVAAGIGLAGVRRKDIRMPLR